MTKLTEDKRKSIDACLAVRKRIEKSFEDRLYTSRYCFFCNWASNGLGLEEAVATNRMHEKTHPEYAEWVANEISFDEVPAFLHDHECRLERCLCTCGCDKGPSCVLVFGPLCAVCIIRDGRGDKDHGMPEEAPK